MELACVIISALAACFSAITAYLGYINGKLISQGNIELQIREMISSAKYRFLEQGTRSPQLFDALNEDILNAYDEACAKYIDRKVDQKRFEKMYQHEIENLVEDPVYAEKFKMPASRYDAILKVYNKWFHKER